MSYFPEYKIIINLYFFINRKIIFQLFLFVWNKSKAQLLFISDFGFARFSHKEGVTER